MADIGDVLRHLLEHIPATPAEHAELAAAIDAVYPPPEPEAEPETAAEPAAEDKDAEIARLKAELAESQAAKAAAQTAPPG